MRGLFKTFLSIISITTFAFATGDTFSCESKSFVSFNTQEWAGDGDSRFNEILLSDGTIISENNITQVNGVINGVNSIGYNVKDNYIWGWNIGAQKVVKIDANHNATLYDIEGLEKRFYVAADVDQNGILYLFSRESDDEAKKIERIDLNTMSKLDPVILNRVINTADFAFSPKDGKLYFVDSMTDKLYSITINGTSGTVDSGRSMHVNNMEDIIINYFDKDGNFYFNKGLNEIYKFNTLNDANATLFSTLDKNLINGDGARCANATVKIPEQKPFSCESSGTVVSYVTSGRAIEGDSNLALISIADGNITSNTVLPKPTKGVNSIGYNVKDDYIWGYNIPLRKIVRIGADKSVSYYEMDNTPDIGGAYYNALDISSDGIMYMKSDEVKNRLDRVELDGSKKTQHVLSSINLDQELHTDDFAFNPKDGKIYFIDYDDGWFKRIDIVGTNGYIKKVKQITQAWTVIAAFDVDGNFYFNNGGQLDKLKISYNGSLMDVDSIEYIKNFSTIDDSLTQGDGARCMNAPMDGDDEPKSTSFTCDDTLYFSNKTKMGTGDSNESTMWLHIVDRNSNPYNFISIGEPYNYTYNTLAYNPVDNFLYATYGVHLLKIDKNANVIDLGVIEGLKETQTDNNPRQHYSGVIDRNGIFYIGNWETMHEDEIFKVDIKQKKVLGTIKLKYNGESKRLAYVDMAISNDDKYLYMMHGKTSADDNKTNQLAKVEIATGKITFIGGAYDGESLVDTIFMDKNNRLFVLYHEGGFYEIDKDSGEKRKVSDAPITANLNDGAMCPDAVVDIPKVEKPKLLADYHFDNCEFTDDKEGDVKDSKGSSDATAYNGVRSVDGVINKSAKFSGGNFDSASYIENKSPDFNLSKNFTISFAINVDDLNSDVDEGILSKTVDFVLLRDKRLAIDVNGQGFGTTIYNKSHTLVSNSKLSGWSEVALVMRDGNLTLYINSKYDNSVNIGNIENIKNELLIGKVSYDYKAFSGKLDELKFFSGALSQDDIIKIYSNEMIKGVNYDGSNREDLSCPTPFACDSNSYVFTSDLNASYTKALKIALIDGNVTAAKASFADAHINAIGFNPIDGYIYGWDYKADNNHIVKVDADYNVTRVEITGDFPPNQNFYIGDVSKDGIYYLSYMEGATDTSWGDVQRIYRVDLNGKKMLPVLNINKGTYSNQIITADFAINPIDDNIYLVNAIDAHLLRIDKDSGDVSDLGYVGITPIQNNSYATYSVYSFFDKFGNYYFQVNRSYAYKIDISKPWDNQDETKAKALQFHEVIIDNSGDGARCALAPLSDMAILSIDQKLIKVIEGNENDENGTNGYDIKFTIRSDRELDSNVSILFGQDPYFGDATRGEDYKTQIGKRLKIQKGARVVSFSTRDVIADSKIEKNEQFEYIFGIDPDSKGSVQFNIDNPTVIIEIKDDDFANFTAFDLDENDANLSKRRIKTKIVGEPFTLRLSSLNTTGIDDFDRNSTIYKLVDSDECKKSLAQTPTDGFALFKIKDGEFMVDQNFTVNSASKDLRVEFVWKDRLGHFHKSCSKDNFAVRPKRFKFANTTLNAHAGKPYSIKIEALDFAQNKTNIYNEHRGVSFRIDANQSKVGCSFDDNGFDISSLQIFTNGELNGTFIYNDVGELKMMISEINGSEFAKVDVNDTGDNQRLIQEAQATIKFVPDHFDIDVTYTNNHTSKGYAFYTNDLSDGPSWTIDVTAMSANGSIAKNFSSGCQSKDVKVSLNAEINTSNILHILPLDKDINGGVVEINQTIAKDDFSDGNGSTTIKVNFRKDPTPMNPSKVKIPKISVSDPDGVDSNKTGIEPTDGVVYQYMRAYIRSPLSVVGSKTLKTQVYYEAYEKGATVPMKDKDGLSLSGEDGWHRVGFDPSSSDMDYSVAGSRFRYNTKLFITKIDKQNLEVNVSDLPEKNSIYLQVTPPFKYKGTRIRSDISFIPDSVNWAGKGKTGRSVDTNVSRRSTFKKMNW